MSWMANLPIRRKLSVVILLTCTFVLLLAIAGLATYELFDFRRALARDMTVLADILGTNTRAALRFQDDTAARETLSALQSEPHVVSAAIYTPDGNRFAEYVSPGATLDLPATPSADGSRFENRHLVVFRPIVHDGKRLGTLYLQSGLGGIYERLGLFAGVAFLMLAGSLLAALIFSRLLQRLPTPRGPCAVV